MSWRWKSAEAVRRMNAVTAEGMEVISFRQIAEEKKMTAMAIASAADYLVGCKCRENGAVFTQERITGFLGQQEIVVTKQTKRSEQEADIRPLIYQMELTKEGIYLQLAAGSAQNLKPELVMSALCRFAGIDEASMTWTRRRLEMYADLTSEEERAEGIRKLVTLEALGKDIE